MGVSRQSAGVFRPTGWDATDKGVRALGDDKPNMCPGESGELKKTQQR